MSRATKPLAQRSRESSAWRLADHEDPNPHSVYRLWAADGTLLYIGCASDVEHRVYMHRFTYTMVDAFLIQQHYDHHTSEVYPTKLEARAAEAAAIKAERPIFNRQHNPTRWRRRNGAYVPVDADTAALMERLSARPEVSPEVRQQFADLLDHHLRRSSA